MSTQQAVLEFATAYFSGAGVRVISIEPIASDASQRCYWRLKTQDNQYVVMDSPPEVADINVFAKFGSWLFGCGVPVPKIYYIDPAGRFLILEDLGNTSLYSVMNDTQSFQTLNKPIEALVALAQLEKPNFLPLFTYEMYIEQARLFDEWCLGKLELGVAPGSFDQLYHQLATTALEHPQGFVHRDYHSYNIHFCPNKPFGIGIIDFQDALWGPQAYDFISLLLDRYITWPEQQIYDAIEAFRVQIQSDLSPDIFKRQTLLISLQRNIRILGVFHRLSLRDKKHIYMNYVPRKAGYCQMVLDHYPDLKCYGDLFRTLSTHARWLKI